MADPRWPISNYPGLVSWKHVFLAPVGRFDVWHVVTDDPCLRLLRGRCFSVLLRRHAEAGVLACTEVRSKADLRRIPDQLFRPTAKEWSVMLAMGALLLEPTLETDIYRGPWFRPRLDSLIQEDRP